MFGGLTNGNSGYPTFPEEQRSQYDLSALPQLQLFGKFPVGCTFDNINFAGNDPAMASGRPIKRAREVEPVSTQQKLLISSNNNAGLTRTTMNPNHVSTGLKLSYGEDEHNSSITSVNENLRVVLDHYAKVQEEHIMKGIRELNQKHTALLLNTLEREVTKKQNEKDAEISIMNRRNTELGLKVKQASMEAESWHHRAKYNESVVNALKNYMQQMIPQKHVQGKEGYGDSEVDDAGSCTNVDDAADLGKLNRRVTMKVMDCKVCNGKEVCVVLLPCRHLCVCKDCEVLVESCPVCHTTRTESVHVLMS